MKMYKWVTAESRIILLVILAPLLMLSGIDVGATESGLYCSETTKSASKACRFEAREDLNIDSAKCINVADDGERTLCEAVVEEEFAEAWDLCGDVKDARQKVCEAIGEDRYDPRMDPDNFVNPLEITWATANPFMPLVPGLVKIFESGDETITVTVTKRTREIMGITAIVVSDIVEEDGELIEVTDDWFAQDMDGNVWYMGEYVLNYEDGVIVDLEGSFEAGVDYARAGILVRAVQQVGDIYRQEWFLDEAEDMAEVVDLYASESAPAASCNGDCLQTREWNPLEPDVSEYKFYAPGIGVIVAYDVEEPDAREELVDIKMMSH